MNGGIIGRSGLHPLIGSHKSGIWVPNDPEMGVLRVGIPTSGLIHHWPLTADGNDIVGTSHLTNNNTVTFSSEGAAFVQASSQYLSATITWPSVFTWSFWSKIQGGKYLYLGNCANDGGYGYYLGLGRWGNSVLKFVTIANSAGGGMVANMDLGRAICDGTWHHFACWGYNPAPSESETGFNLVGAFVDGYLFGGTAIFPAKNISTSFSIGRPGAINGGYGTGNIRDFKAFNRLLSAKEVLAMAA